MAERKRPALNGPTIETAPSNRRHPRSAVGARRLATWEEIDTAGRVWTISAARMKAKRDDYRHRL